MHVPEPMRTHWAAVVEAMLHAPIATDSEQYRRDDDTRGTPVYVVKHADSQPEAFTAESDRQIERDMLVR